MKRTLMFAVAAALVGCGPHDVGSWTPQQQGFNVVSSGTTANLLGVFAVSPTRVYAVGESGTVLDVDGANVSALSGVATDVTLEDVAATGPGDFTAVGSSAGAGVVAHRSNGAWTLGDVTDPARPAAYGVALAGSQLWTAGGTSPAAYITRKMGTSWQRETLPTAYSAMLGVAATSSTDVYLTHLQGVLKFDGQSFVDVSPRPDLTLTGAVAAVPMGTETRLFLAGENGWLAVSPFVGGSAYYVGGSTWNGVAAAAPDQALAVGVGGKVARWDGTDWTLVTQTATTEDLQDVHVASDGTYWIVGNAGTLLHYVP